MIDEFYEFGSIEPNSVLMHLNDFTQMYNHVILKVIMTTIMITLNFKIMIMIKILIIRKI
jgi:hypothetical protein